MSKKLTTSEAIKQVIVEYKHEIEMQKNLLLAEINREHETGMNKAKKRYSQGLITLIEQLNEEQRQNNHTRTQLTQLESL